MTARAAARARAYLSDDELRQLGIGAAGAGVRVSRHALLLAPGRITIGDGSVVEAFVTLSASAAGLRIGRGVRLDAYSSILGQDLVEIGDDVEVGMRCAV